MNGNLDSKKNNSSYKRFRNILLLRMDNIIISLGTMVYGLQHFIHPEMLSQYRIYKDIDDIIDGKIISVASIIIGLVGLIATLGNMSKLRRITNSINAGMWTFLATSFLLSEPPNSIWVITFMITGILLSISLKEGVDE